MSLFRLFLGGLALTPLAISIAACGGPSLSDICDASTACHGGNDKDKAACVDQAKTLQEEAADVGCHREFNDWYECLAGAATCQTQAGGACTTNANCTMAGATGVCTNMVCQMQTWGIPAGNTSCESVMNAYQSCVGQ